MFKQLFYSLLLSAFLSSLIVAITPKEFIQAAETGNIALVKQYIQEGGDVNALYPGFKDTALMRAAKSGHENIVDFLLEHNVDPSIKDLRGETALHLAAVEGHKSIVMKLLATGKAAINVQDKSGDTPLHRAVLGNGDMNFIRFLLEQGARVDVKNEPSSFNPAMGNKTPLEVAQALSQSSGMGHPYAAQEKARGKQVVATIEKFLAK